MNPTEPCVHDAWTWAKTGITCDDCGSLFIPGEGELAITRLYNGQWAEPEGAGDGQSYSRRAVS